MTRQEQLYYIFEPKGCWHDWKHIKHKGINHYECACSVIQPEMFGTELPANPDFSTPDGFFWMIERAKKAEWWKDFIVEHCGIVNLNWWWDRQHANLDVFTSPTALFEALCKYHGIKEGE